MITPYPEYQVPAVRKTRQALIDTGRALVVMATGLGKTIVGALSIRDLLKLGKGLFLCHLNSGLDQSLKQFRDVLGDSVRCGVFHGEKKHWEEVDILFASFQTLVDWKHAFFEDEFRFVIVDESHHGQAPTFKQVIKYFKPKELLALTATPDRMDEKDIREIFGQEVVNITLEEGIAKGWLAQVEYRLVTDNLNRGELTKIAKNVLRHGKKISMKQLNETIFIETRDEKIAEIILGYGQKKTIIFCENVCHADNFQKFLPGSKVYHSKIGKTLNRETLKSFRRGECRCILVVDKMNECIDIPDAELIVFLRCTDSKTVFLQQLGRGLRRTANKRKVIVLDFVANADRVMIIREMVERITQFAPNWVELETDPHYVKGSAFEFVFTDEQIDLFEVLDRIARRYVSDIPEMLADYSERNSLPADRVLACTRKLLWWKCPGCGGEHLRSGQQRMKAHRRGRKHGYCDKRKVPRLSLSEFSPKLAGEYLRSNPIPVDKVSAASELRCGWKCSSCAHVWRASIRDRVKKNRTGCPVCGGQMPTQQYNLLALFPEIAAEYSDENTTPVAEVMPFSGQRFSWTCSRCHHKWKTSAGNRTRHGTGCPVCQGAHRLPKAPATVKKIVRLKRNLVTRPDLVERYSARNEIPVTEISLGAHKKCWWRCPDPDCGHEWQSPPRNRARGGVRCPKCHK